MVELALPGLPAGVKETASRQAAHADFWPLLNGPFLRDRSRHQRGIVFSKWIGSPADYDKIDVRTVKYGD
jgi:hypothetical protein